MRLSLCNEVVRELPFAEQCAFAAAVGYDGIELAPFTLSDEPHKLAAAQRAQARRALADAGLPLTGLHWLLVTPKGLSITSADAAVRARTQDVMLRLIELCAELGGRVLVHGSPAQRRLEPGREVEQRGWAQDALAAAGEAAAAAGVTYCIEPLAPRETNYVNTVAEGVALVEAVGSLGLRTMLDTCAAGNGEAEPPAALVARWLPSGLLAHVHVNDRNRRAPGQGRDRFAPLFAALRERGYGGVVSVEPFVYEPDGRACAARAIGYLRGILEALP